jgi:magnesium chelatase family protein
LWQSDWLTASGPIPKGGEESLAPHGVLSLDELPEFKREALEVLRQPPEDDQITTSRAATSPTRPACCAFAAVMDSWACAHRLQQLLTGDSVWNPIVQGDSAGNAHG